MKFRTKISGYSSMIKLPNPLMHGQCYVQNSLTFYVYLLFRYDKNETRDYLRFDPRIDINSNSTAKRDEGEKRKDQEKRMKEYEGTMRKKPSGEVQGEDPDVLVCVDFGFFYWDWYFNENICLRTFEISSDNLITQSY